MSEEQVPSSYRESHGGSGPGLTGARSLRHPCFPKKGPGRASERLAQVAWSLLVFLVALSVYGFTLAPTFTWSHDAADGGDLIAAASTLGVPHPSGYPTYVLLARLFLRLLPMQEPAVRVHWLSALSAAASAMLLGLSVVESLHNGTTREPPGAGEGDAEADGAAGSGHPSDEDLLAGPALRWQTRLAAASAALVFAFSPLQWSQATVAEVHALNGAFVAVVFWLLLRWRSRGSLGLAVTAVFLYALGLGNHLTGL
ncbi:MAG TPA: DUF2723 domain-containing protein, partial [Anaerolineae bacterium]|nr:DUF2723 domain-containing protein [Anaerolineae bacterium]